MALDSEQPDERRKGVIGLAKGPDGRTDWAVKVFETLARTDPDAMVRCAALRAMLPTIDPARIETCLLLLISPDKPVEGVKKAPATVRWCAARLLCEGVRSAAFEESQKGPIVETLIERIPGESDQNAKLEMIETLGYFPERRVLDALVDSMTGPNFTINHAAELSLAELTGVTHDHNPDAWRKWLSETEDPFANAGVMPESLEAKGYRKKWDRLGWMD